MPISEQLKSAIRNNDQEKVAKMNVSDARGAFDFLMSLVRKEDFDVDRKVYGSLLKIILSKAPNEDVRDGIIADNRKVLLRIYLKQQDLKSLETLKEIPAAREDLRNLLQDGAHDARMNDLIRRSGVMSLSEQEKVKRPTVPPTEVKNQVRDIREVMDPQTILKTASRRVSVSPITVQKNLKGEFDRAADGRGGGRGDK